MAYAALISLQKTFEASVNDHLRQTNKKLLMHLFWEIYSSRTFLQRNLLGSEERQITEAVRRLEDAFESYVPHQVRLQSEIIDGDDDDEISYPLTQSQDMALGVIVEEINLFIKTVKEINKKQSHNSSLSEQDNDAAHVSSGVDHHHLDEKKSTIFGLDDDIISLKDMLTGDTSGLLLVPIFGMAGIGKTTLAKQVYGDPDIVSHFECRVFVSIGPRYRFREILVRILAQILHPGTDATHEESEKELLIHLHDCLKRKRYLIVLDDIWDEKVWDMLSYCLPDDKMGSRIILTSRIEGVALSISSESGKIFHKMRFLNEEESWHLLRANVFGEENLCPPQLEKAGRKIAEKCQGLPLTIIAIANHLSQAEKNLEYWQKVANEVHIVISADKHVSKVLSSSYYYLPQHLKPCFLYMGVFPHDYDISATKLIKLWHAEGFLESWWTVEDLEYCESEDSDTDSESEDLDISEKLENLGVMDPVSEDEDHATDPVSEDFAMTCLKDLVSRNVVQVRERSSSGGIKTCNVYSAFWHICIREGWQDKFFHVINSCANQDIESQRRLCIHNNALCGIKDVRKSMQATENAHSLLCTGPHHQYPVPIYLSFGLLKVLDALTIRFYDFPAEVLKLVRLRAFSVVSAYGDLDYARIKASQVMGSDLPNPSSEDALLPNLLTLLDVSGRSCTKKVVKRIPNLEKLGIRIETGPDDVEPLYCFHNLVYLRQLQSLKCSVMNPSVVPASLVPSYPPSLKKLTLSGLGYPWGYMSDIAELRNLEVLKLRCYAFRGRAWETYEGEFFRLKYLLIEDTDLEHWYVDYESFPSLERLILQHCYKLKEIPSEIGELPNLEEMELVDCHPSLVASAKRIAEEQQSAGNDVLQVLLSPLQMINGNASHD
ncbi:UNVERIFIED_CONTAM: putative late blight resistance proteinR1C-3 [Sesamum calycinum]|uniref:Late blight resistance proteinR1C-3 n=1 Tax=Sesamum calycinum TaxID=2727403 RepID=A0AAW2JCT6_9LAMI